MVDTKAPSPVLPPYAPHIRRLSAALIDGAIISIITMTIRLSLNGGDFSKITTNGTAGSSQNTLVSLVTLIIGAFYYIGFWVKRNGQTPGKQAMHLKIMKVTQEPIDWFTAIIRYLGTIVSGAVFALGYLWILFDKRHQGWHDKLAKTLVVESDDQKPKGFITFLGCFLPVLFFVILIGIGAVAAYAKIQESRSQAATGASIQKAITSMNAEAKVHFDKSADLFKQMRAAGSDAQKVKQLNDRNIAELQAAAALEPNNPQIWFTLGQAFTWVNTTGTLEDGVKAFQKAEQLDPTNEIYIANVADMLWRSGKNDDAILEANKAIRLDEDNYAFPHEVLARAYTENKIYDIAKTEYQKAIDIWTKHNTTGQFDDDILQARKEMASLPK